MTYDVAVVGLGGIGSAIAAHCAKRGASVIGFEQFGLAHDLGSSHGRSRMIRQAYFEDAAYVPLVLRSYELWRALEKETNEQLLRLTGVLSVGNAGSNIIAGTRRAAIQHRLALEELSAAQVRERYPTLVLQPDEVAVFEPDGGVLDPEGAIRAHSRVAQTSGAQLRFETSVKEWEAGAHEVRLRLDDGSTVMARRLVVSLGPWIKQTLETLGVPIRVQRNVQAWFSPGTHAYDAGQFPGFLLDRAGLVAPLYGFPDFGHGVKAAFHGAGELTTAEHLNRDVDMSRDVTPIVHAMNAWMPGATARFREAKPCMYSLTPDSHFVIDRHPAHSNVILCGGFSGHGFKFAPVVGEVAAELVVDGESRHNIGFLSLQRFVTTTGG